MLEQILQPEDVAAIIKQKIVCSEMGIKSLYLFGSVARREATRVSDLDFLVDFEGKITFDRYMDLKLLLEDIFQKKIDLVLKDSLKHQITQQVMAEAIDVT